MSERLYYTDAYLTRFDAHVADTTVHEGRPAVRLDRTAFYPASGGQPADRGTIQGVAVADVIDGEETGILHVLERPLDAAGSVACEIDWPRRHDHMQQHTAQHLLSALWRPSPPERRRGRSGASPCWRRRFGRPPPCPRSWGC